MASLSREPRNRAARYGSSGARSRRLTATDASGRWEARFAGAEIPADGLSRVEAVAIDVAGNASLTTAAQVSVNTSGPLLSITSIGTTGDSAINAAEAVSVQVVGSAEPNASIAVTWNGVNRNALTGSDGSWTVTFAGAEVPNPAEPTGAQFAMAIRAVSVAGNVSTTSVPIVVDRVAPVATVAVVEGDNRVTPAERANGIPVTGTVEPGANVQVIWNGATRSAAVDPNGNWSVVFPETDFANLVPGGASPPGFVTVANDRVGNVGAPTPPAAVVVEPPPPPPPPPPAACAATAAATATAAAAATAAATAATAAAAATATAAAAAAATAAATAAAATAAAAAAAATATAAAAAATATATATAAAAACIGATTTTAATATTTEASASSSVWHSGSPVVRSSACRSTSVRAAARAGDRAAAGITAIRATASGAARHPGSRPASGTAGVGAVINHAVSDARHRRRHRRRRRLLERRNPGTARTISSCPPFSCLPGSHCGRRRPVTRRGSSWLRAPGPEPPDAPLAWALTIGTGDQDTGTGAGVGVMPTPAPGGASQGPPALSLDSLLITAASRTWRSPR